MPTIDQLFSKYFSLFLESLLSLSPYKPNVKIAFFTLNFVLNPVIWHQSGPFTEKIGLICYQVL